MQILIKNQNPFWSAETKDELNINPDNDVRLSPEQIKHFKVPICPQCSNDRLKPDLVFFGDNIPKNRGNLIISKTFFLINSYFLILFWIVELVNKKLSESDAILIVGTSLQVNFYTNASDKLSS